jgi:glycosyltransferase involved in cell wall biosynthesis
LVDKNKLIIEMTTSDMSMKLLSYNRVEFLLSQGYNLRGLCSDGPFSDKLKEEEFPFDTIRMEREISPVKDIISLIKLIRYFRRKRPYVVFTHTPKAGILGPVAARLARVPHIIHVVHGLIIHDRAPFHLKILGWLMEKHCIMWSDFCLSQSKEDCNRAVQYNLSTSKRFRYLGNGINISEYDQSSIPAEKKVELLKVLKIPEKSFIIGFVGRMVKEKGILEIVKAIPEVMSVINNAHFLLIGPSEKDQFDGLSEDYLKLLGEKYPVTWVSFSSEIKNLMSIMNLFILPTYREGVPRALMEASSMACPCIASDVRGCREVVVHRKTGFLIEPRSAEALEKSIIDVWKMSDEQRINMGRNAREHILKNFDEKRIFKRFQRICNILLTV